MPFPGIPAGSELEQKIDRCVEDVMSKQPDTDKSTAIAICRESIDKKDVEKFFGSIGAATSFDELEQQRLAHEQAEGLIRLTDDFQQLVENIMWSPDIEDKGVAIRKLGAEFANRLDSGDYSKELTLPILERESQKKENLAQKLLSTIKSAFSRSNQRLTKETVEGGSGFLVFKDKGGTLRWIARYSNNLRDDDYPVREIISSKSHQLFEMAVDFGLVPPPELWLWHKKEWKFGQAEWVAYDDSGFAMAGGYILPGFEDVAYAVAALPPAEVGVSHGMKDIFIRRDTSDKSIIVNHITHEISPLPKWAAANQRTDFAVLSDELKEKNNMAFSKDKRDQLIEWGMSESVIDMIEELNQGGASKAADAGVESKEAGAETPVETPVAETPVAEVVAEPAVPVIETPVEETPAEESVATEPEEEQLAEAEIPATDPELVEAMKSTMTAVTALADQVKSLTKEVQSLKQSDEKKIADKSTLTPLASMAQIMMNSVIGNPETHVDGRTSLAKSGPAETKEHRQVYGIPIVDQWVTNADRS